MQTPSKPSLCSFAAFLLLGSLTNTGFAAAPSVEGKFTVEYRHFAEEANPPQHDNDVSVDAEIKLRWDWNNRDDQLIIIPALRGNNRDSGQNRFDFRSLSLSMQRGNYEWRLGMRTVTWQVVESNHLVDIVNQVDASSDVDGEDKLGELMLNLVRLTDWGSIELLVMPGFRERLLPGEEARLRPPLPFDEDNATYESGAEENRTDAAFRLTWIPGDLELSLTHFSGTSREPQFQLVFDGPFPSPGAGAVIGGSLGLGSGEFTLPNALLRPEYRVIDQTGLELQYAAGDWLWKLEAISNSGFEDNRYSAAVAGFEFTWAGLGYTGYDLGVLAEYLWDEREDAALQGDVFAGVRLGLNDIAGTELLAGFIVDQDSGEYLATAEFSRRFGSRWRFDVEARVFGGSDEPQSDFEFLHREDYVNLKITRYF